jgi:hypothetical protein
MEVDDLDLEGVTGVPMDADAPLLINSDAVLTHSRPRLSAPLNFPKA